MCLVLFPFIVSRLCLSVLMNSSKQYPRSSSNGLSLTNCDHNERLIYEILLNKNNYNYLKSCETNICFELFDNTKQNFFSLNTLSMTLGRRENIIISNSICVYFFNGSDRQYLITWMILLCVNHYTLAQYTEK